MAFYSFKNNLCDLLLVEFLARKNLWNLFFFWFSKKITAIKPLNTVRSDEFNNHLEFKKNIGGQQAKNLHSFSFLDAFAWFSWCLCWLTMNQVRFLYHHILSIVVYSITWCRTQTSVLKISHQMMIISISEKYSDCLATR